LSDALGHRLPFDSLKALRTRLFAAHPLLGRIGEIAPTGAFDPRLLIAAGGAYGNAPFISTVGDFYLTNPIARASAVMAECSALRLDLARQAAE
jgi:NADH-quinone oxidoreductase subunit G